MATFETKFSIGDVVWNARIEAEPKQHPCPDCLGAREWEAKSPAGATFKVACPRCAAHYMSNPALGLKYMWWTPSVRRLTIGMVRPCDGHDGQNRYMCHETGVGSGSVYDEADLYATEAEALAAAETKAQVANLDAAGWVAKQYAATAEFSDYQLKDAAIESAKSAVNRMRARAEILLADIDDAETIEDVQSAVERWRGLAEAA